MQERYVQTGDVKTFYLEAGEGRPLILLHGGGAGADAKGNWDKVINLYAERGFHVFAYDAIGFGKTDKPDPAKFSYNQEARETQLLHFIDQLGLEKPTLIGNSMGGLTSLGFAMKYPEKIDKLILMGTGKPLDNSDGFKSLLNYKIGRDHMYKIVRKLTNKNFEVSEEMIDYRFELTKKPGTMEAYVAIMEGIVELEFKDEDLSKIEHPTLLVHGTLDEMVPKERSYHLVETLPNAWMYIIPHCGHWAMMEYPQEFARVTSDFIVHH